MGTRLKLIEQSFTNKLGEVINIGDRVVIVTSGYRAHVRRGTYLGYYEREGYRGKKNIRVSVAADEVRSKRLHKDTGIELDWRSKYPTPAELGVENPGLAPVAPAGYYHNYGYNRNPLSQVDRESYMRELQAHIVKDQKYSEAKAKWLNETYPEVKEGYVRRIMLQRNLIFKSAEALVGQSL